MGSRRTPRLAGSATLAALVATAVVAISAPTAQADGGTPPTGSNQGSNQSAPGTSTRTVVPLPKVTVTKRCGSLDDILTVDPAWLAQWGDKVLIFPNSLTFQGGTDGTKAKPAGMILEPYRAQYTWAGSHGVGWSSWLLYPGTVKPVVDTDTVCPVTVPVPRLTQSVRCGAANDRVTIAEAAAADQWYISDRTWHGSTLTVSLRVKRGFVGPDGVTEVEQDFTDDGSCPAA